MLLLKTWFIWCGPSEINRTDLTKKPSTRPVHKQRRRSRNGENVSVFVGRQKGPGELRCLTCLCGVGGMCNSPVAVGRKDMIHTTWIRYDSRKRSRLWSGVAIKSRAIWISAKKKKKNSVWFSRDTRTSETLADLADRTRGSLIFVMKATATICNIHGEPENEMNINKDFDLTATSPLAPVWYVLVHS